jgi:predicted nucleic acid-binding protein
MTETHGTGAGPAHPVHVVLDTNVVLDLLVWDDPHSRPLGEALEAGRLVAWADAETLGELAHVLGYASFGLTPEAQAAHVSRYRALVSLAPPPPEGAPTPSLPRCKDRDDQKFLALAARVGAGLLVSKDRLLLCLRGHAALTFDILPPLKAVRLLAARPG